jgi:ABC-type multidrug transport system permease subunit
MQVITVETVFWLIVGAAVIHVFEEYFTGFMDWMKNYSPKGFMDLKKFSPKGTKLFFIIVNSLFIVLCVLAAIVNQAIPFFSLSIAFLLIINALLHVSGAIRVRSYAPGVVSAVILYIPLSFYTYYLYYEAGLLALTDFTLSVVLALVWQIVPIALILISIRIKTTKTE